MKQDNYGLTALILRTFLLVTAINVKTASTTINCKLAKQLCENDQACHSITSIIPRLCGQELVSCSTVTVTKCRAALRTLAAFQFFQPTCLCKEPRIDPDCNKYRNLVFDHPCFITKHRDKDPYSIQALPTCGYALNTCQQQQKCFRVYEDYISACHFSGEQCHVTNSSACFEAWNQLKMSPVFGCICPNLNDVSCVQIYEAVHKNPCIELLPQHGNSTTRHSSHAPLHRLLHPPPGTPRRQPLSASPAAALPPRMPARSVPATPRPATWRVVVSSPLSVSVSGLGGTMAGGRLADPLLVAPLFDLTSERPRTSVMERTLHGNDLDPDDVITDDDDQFTDVEHAPGGPSGTEEDVFQSSCHIALENCLRDPRCSEKLEPMLSDCDETVCNREMCMERMQEFYSDADSVLVLDSAFCVCRRSGAGDGACVRAMNQLHPACARQSAAGTVPSCHSVARSCRRRPDGRCRPRLELFEQACAVDALTQRCAGPTPDCRLALLGVLGTQLHSRCACQGAGGAAQHVCSDWERLLWANPCVVEVQREFHRQRAASLGPARRLGWDPGAGSATAHQKPRLTDNPARRVSTTTATTTTATTTTTAASTRAPTSRPRPPPPLATPAWTTPAWRPAPTPPPQQPAYCTSRKQGQIKRHIPVGSGLRYYTLDDSENDYRVEKDCSELCMCHGRNRLVCNTLDCMEKTSCQSKRGVYPHGSAGLLSSREGCMCHHGDFVCMRPAADEYTLPFGVFLFLGYSRKDEELLHPHTHKTVKDDTIPELEQLLEVTMRQTGQNFLDWPCKLSVRQHFDNSENIIIQAKLDEVEEKYNHSLSHELLKREKEKCTGPLKDISFMVNNREPEILSHPLLSVFKMADVDVTTPDTSGAGTAHQRASALLALTLLLAALA